MEGLMCPEFIFLVVCGFVEEQIYLLNHRRKVGLPCRVATIGIAPGLCSRCGEFAIGHEGAVGQCPVHACFYIVDLAHGNLVHVNHVAADVGKPWFFAEQVAATRYAMAQGKAPYLYATIFVDEGMDAGIDCVEQYFELQIGTKEAEGGIEESFQLLWPVDVELGSAPEQAHGADESGKPQTVVGMGV